MINPKSLDKVLNLYVYGSSGTYLLHSLLDNHSHVLTMPIPMFNYYYDFFDANADIDADVLIERMVNEWGVLFDPQHKRHDDDVPTLGVSHGLDRMGPNKDQSLVVDKDNFVKILKKLLEGHIRPTRKFFFQAVHVAYAEAQGRKIECAEPWIVYQLHWPDKERTEKVIEDFPDAHFIHMVREPGPSLASFFKGLYAGEAKFKSTQYAARCMDVILRGAPPVLEKCRNTTRVIRLEDLHTDGENTMRKLATWINIPWSDTMIESTFNGKKWWSVPSRKGELSGFNIKRVQDKNDDVMSSIDDFKIKALLFDFYESWGYEPRSCAKSFFMWLLVFPLIILPFKMELLSYKNATENEGMVFFAKHLLRMRLLSLKAWLRRGYRPFKYVIRRGRNFLKGLVLECKDAAQRL